MKATLLIISFFISIGIAGQDKKSTETTVFKASIHCENCEAKIMKQIPYEKGVKDVKVDLDNQLVIVAYKSAKNDEANLAGAITDLGYEVEVIGQPLQFQVYGNCDMCKERIEKVMLETNGVHAASWDVQSKLLNVVYNRSLVDKQDLYNRISSVGHDTDYSKADNDVYNALPDCCRYRK